MLLGRAAELEEMRRLVGRLAEGTGFCIVLQGGAGIGKTAVLDALAADCGDQIRVLRASGTQRESELVFAGLSELLGPVMGHVGDLPERQRAILRSSLALVDVTAHSDLEVFVAATSLLTSAAGAQPVLCLIDDAHWVDAASVDALLFAAKRMRGNVGFVFATRDDLVSRLDATSVPRRSLHPLDRDAARRLVLDANPDLPPSTIDDVVEYAEGYPLALIEFARHATGGRTLHSRVPLPVSERIQRVFSEQARALAPAARTALVVLAASDHGYAAVVTRAIERLAHGVSALDAVLDSGLVRKDGECFVFRHPIARSSAYQSATEAERRAAHAALADVLSASQPEQAAWHRGLSSVAPDEDVAAALEDTAESARRRGGRLAEACALELAARLSPDGESGTRRLLAAGSAALQAGRHALSRRLLDEVVTRSSDVCVLADAAHLLAQIAFWQDGRLPRDLARAADQVESVDAVRAARLLSFSLVPLISDCQVDAALPIAQRAWALIGHGVRPFDVAFRVAHVFVMAADPRGAELAQSVAAAAERDDDVAAMIMISQPLWWLERYAEAGRLLELALTKARASDSLWMLCHGFINQAELGRRIGRLGLARAAAAEALALAEQLGDPMQRAEALVQLAAVEAHLGNAVEALAHAEQALRIVDARSAGATELRLTAAAAQARVALGARRPLEAVERLQPLVERVLANGVRDPAVIPCVSDLLDAHIAAGRDALGRLDRLGPVGLVDQEVARLEAWLTDAAHRCGRRWAILAAARCAALRSPQSGLDVLRQALADDDGADALLTARGWLTYGELVRRGGERANARTALARADQAFRAAGAEAWYERVAAELRACGEASSAAAAVAAIALTPQEDRIARLAGSGARNREIAKTLSLSEKTVETHLAAAFRKLGIRSRTELAGLFVPRG
jgi:DNA-binding CsgD family transcriptional regulator